MATDAQFKAGEVVAYRDGNGDEQIAVVTSVVQKNPAQYRVSILDVTDKTLCGESETENGAVFAL